MRAQGLARRVGNLVWLKALAVCLAVWCAGARVRADESGFFEVQVRLRVDHLVKSTTILAILKDETESIWRPYGVQVEWVDAQLGDVAAEGFSVEAVIDRRTEGPADPDRAVLGRAFVPKDAVGAGPIRVSFNATERMLMRRHASGPFVAERDMGRALGRVLAHEIGHVLLAVRNHDHEGLMRAVFTPVELGAPGRESFRLSRDGLGRLRSRIEVMTAGSETRSGQDPDRAPCPFTAVP
jgi:hypothetical protein